MREDFDVESHREFIHRRGESIRWRRASQCSCLDLMGGTINRSCPVCGGVGYSYELQNPPSDIALVRQVDQQRQFAQFGQLLIGDITVTTMPDEMPIAEGDLIDLVARKFRQSDVIAHSGLSDALHWQPAVELVEVRSLDTVYEIGVEDGQVGVAEDGSGMAWHFTEGSPDLPAVGERLSVTYLWSPRYIVIPAMISTRRVVEGVQMPQRAVARLRNRDEVKQ